MRRHLIATLIAAFLGTIPFTALPAHAATTVEGNVWVGIGAQAALATPCSGTGIGVACFTKPAWASDYYLESVDWLTGANTGRSCGNFPVPSTTCVLGALSGSTLKVWAEPGTNLRKVIVTWY